MKRSAALLAIFAAPLALLAVPTTGNAQISSDIVQQQKALEQARARAQKAREYARQLQDRVAEARADADRTAAERAALEAQVEEAAAELTAAEARLRLIDSRQQERLRLLGEMQGPLVGLVAALQSQARRPALLALVEPQSIGDVVHVRAIMAAMQPDIDSRTQKVRAEIARARLYRKQEALANDALVSSRDKLDGRREQLSRLEASQRARVTEISDQVEAERLRAYGLGERTRDLIESYENREVDADLADRLAKLPAPKLRTRNKPSGTDADNAVYRLPVEGRLVAGLGEATDYGFREKGITIAADEGASVVAPASGKILFAGNYRSFGNIVIIDHGAGWASVLTGLGSVSVREGQQVSMGALLGRPGAAYPGVTVELRREGRAVDLIALLG